MGSLVDDEYEEGRKKKRGGGKNSVEMAPTEKISEREIGERNEFEEKFKEKEKVEEGNNN